MKDKFITLFKSYNLYIFLLPVFFVLHGFSEFYNLIKIPKALELITYYLIGTAAVLLLSKFFLKTWTRAALLTLVVMGIYFFFGAFQDLLMAKFKGSLITRYSFLLPAILIILLVTFIYLKKTKHSFVKIKLYLNALFLLLIVFDCYNITTKANRKTKLTLAKETQLPVCNGCPKPDIYFILTDGYPGNTALKKFFDFDNSVFENHLREKGFFIADSSFSNYNYTVFSTGSMLNMDMLNIPGYYNGKIDLPIGFDAVKYNRIVGYLEKEGYEIYNNSIFDLQHQSSKVKKVLVNLEKTPLTSQTLLYRINKDLGYHLITTLKLKFLEENSDNSKYNDLQNNRILDSLTRITLRLKSNKPKFVTTHLVMPHWPYYFDSTGKQIAEELLHASLFYNERKNFISYLKYVNRELLSLIDEIYNSTNGKAIIMLVSDHGCRECLENDPNRGNAELLNLSAIYFPDKNYSGFYKGMSNVNLFRVVLNNQFKKQLPLLKDSLVILKKEN